MQFYALMHALTCLERWITGLPFLILLLSGGVFFTLYLGVPQLRYFGRSLRYMFGTSAAPGSRGDASPLQVLSASLGASIGVGSVAGVSLAVHLGGPSSIFWLLITAFLGMVLKMVEVLLGHRYRQVQPDGSFSGGTMFVLKNRLNLPKLGFIAALCAFIGGITGPSISQANTMVKIMNYAFHLPKVPVTLCLTGLLAIIIFGGIQRIGQVAEALIPFMTLLFLGTALSVLYTHRHNVWPAWCSIFTHLWSPRAALGGFVGASAPLALWQGVNKSFFTSEAGAGTGSIVHAASRTHDSVHEAVTALIEPFLSVIVVCLLTAMVLLSTGSWHQKRLHTFSHADMEFITRVLPPMAPAAQTQLRRHLLQQAPLPQLNGKLCIHKGQLPKGVTLIHARSIAESVQVYQNNRLFNGTLTVVNGSLSPQQGIVLRGKSLLHAADLAAYSFQQGVFGKWGMYLMTICLLLFAFTTVTGGYYFSDRSLTYMSQNPWVLQGYRLLFLGAFSFGCLTDASIIWQISGMSIALGAYPTVLTMLVLRKEIKAALGKLPD